MDSGVNSATRFGLRGSEDLGNGLKVGFKLENGFSSDSGKLGEDRLFGREATVNVSGDFGTVYMGRLGTLVSIRARSASTVRWLRPSAPAGPTTSPVTPR